jgi:hypothetical protein
VSRHEQRGTLAVSAVVAITALVIVAAVFGLMALLFNI